MPGEVRMARKIGQRPLAPALIGLRMDRADAQRESRPCVEEETVGMVVVNDQEHIRFDRFQPLPRGLIAVEHRRP